MKIIDLNSLDADNLMKEVKPINRHSKWKSGTILQTKDIRNMNKDDTWNFLMNMGFIDGNKLFPIDYSKINGSLKDKPLAVIGSGFSGKGIDWNQLKNIKTLGINHIVDIYPDLDMLIFQDHRFVKKTTTDLTKFKGKIFVSNANPIVRNLKGKRLITFVPLHTRKRSIKLDLENGLYARKSTGLCAVHLALCLGAAPIYLIGLDNPKDWETSFTDYSDGIHIKKEYTGSVNTKEALKGYLPVLNMYKTFIPFKNRIIDVCENGIMDWFKRISIDDFNRILDKKELKGLKK